MSKPKATATQPKVKLAFDINEALKTGFLKKKSTVSWKERFFVLYPNFLVIYSERSKWEFDKQVGRLGSRKGALNLKGATVSFPRELPHGSRFPFSVNAPNPSNDPSSLLLDVTSADERQSWEEAINKSIT